MEKSRSLFQQVIGHKMLFVAFLLFATDILAEDDAPKYETNHVTTTANVNLINHVNTTANVNLINHVNTKANVNLSTSPFPTSSKMATEISVTSLPTMPYTLNRNLDTSVQPAVSFKETPPVSKQELKSATAVNTPVPEDTSSPMPSKVSVSTKEKHPRTQATDVQESTPTPVQKEVTSKITVIPYFYNATVSSPTEDMGTRSQGSVIEQSTNATAYLETTKSTEPKEDRKRPMPPGQAVPELTQIPKTGRHYTSGPFTTSVTSSYINNESISDSSDERASEKKHTVIILAVVFTILLLVGLLAFLCLRHRRHSGSTNFNSPEWAGQATLPDDTGLDKDMEQQAGSVGEGETRRGTLVTFFGKRQSRVPSIAMEDVNGKGGKEETEQLLCRESETGSPSEAIGDANGKVPKPLKRSSQESPAPIS